MSNFEGIKRGPGRPPRIMPDAPSSGDTEQQQPRPQVYERHAAASSMPKYGQGHVLDLPRAPAGLDLKWIRFSINGRDDVANVSAMRIQGWEPVPAEEASAYGWTNPAQHDFIFGHSNASGSRDPWVRYADVMLFKRPTAIGDQERREKTRRASNALRALDENVFNEFAKSGARPMPREVTEQRESINPSAYE